MLPDRSGVIGLKRGEKKALPIDDDALESISLPVRSKSEDDEDCDERTGMPPTLGPHDEQAADDKRYDELRDVAVSGDSDAMPPSTSYGGNECSIGGPDGLGLFHPFRLAAARSSLAMTRS